MNRWKNGVKLYEKKYGYLLDSIYKGSDVVEAANLVSRHLQEPVFIYCEDFELPHIGPRYLFSHRYGSCVDAADIVTYAFSGCRHSLYGRYGCQRGTCVECCS